MGKDSLISLPCKDRIHLDCLKCSFDEGYKEQDLSKFKCQLCQKVISDDYIVGKLGIDYYEKKADVEYYKYCYEEKLKNQSKSIICINNNCLSLYFYNHNNVPDQFYTCLNCNTGFCTKCNSDVHTAEPDCMKNQQNIIAAARSRFCPNCKLYYSKACGTCNKMRCGRGICKIIFCNLCFKIFKTEQDCYNHFNKVGDPCKDKLWLETDY
jgi:hypothetical protein